ncbi:MAG: TonB-dependent receptor [Acidobacteriota bacterium]
MNISLTPAVLAGVLLGATPTVAAEIHGRVVDSSTGRGLSGVAIDLPDLGPELELEPHRTDDDGGFRFAFPEGRWTLSFQLPGYVQEQRAVDSTTRSPLNVMLRPLFQETLTIEAIPSWQVDPGRLRQVDLRREADADLGETLRLLPGAGSVRRGPLGLDPVVRGLRETQLGTFVDGTRMFGAGPARMDSAIAHVDPLDIKSLTVIKGPHALAHGSGAMSAVLATTDGAPDLSERCVQGELVGSFDSNGDRSALHAAVAGGGPRHSVAFSATRRQGNDVEDGAGRKVDAEHESDAYRLAARFEFTETDLVSLQLAHQDQSDVDYPGRLLDATFFDTRSVVVDWSHRSESQRAPDFDLQVYRHRIRHDMNNDDKPTAQASPMRTPPFPILVEVETESETTGLRWIGRWSGEDRWLLQAGIDAYRLERAADRRVGNRSNGMTIFEDAIWPDVTIEDIGLFAAANIVPREDLEWSLGLRIDRFDSDAGRSSQYFLDNTSGELDQGDTNVSVTASLSWRPADDWTIQLGLGRVPRSPGALERYSDRFPATRFQLPAEFVGDPELDPEVATELDFGLSHETERVSFFLDLFYRDIDDYITVIADPSLSPRLPLSPPTVYRYVNGSGARFHGGEIGIEVRPGSNWSLGATASWLRGTDEELDEPALGVPPLHGTIHVQRRIGPVTVQGRARWSDHQDRVATARFEQETAGWTVYDLLVDADLPRGASLSFRIENLTDHDHVDHLASSNPFTGRRIAEPGRSFGLSLGWQF